MTLSLPPHRFTSDSRGQLLLLGAIIIVISLVILVFTLNTVLYAQNVESHETSPQGKEAGEYLDTAKQSFGSAIIEQNTQNHATQTDARQNTFDSLYAVNKGLGAQYAHRSGIYATINPFEITDGTVIRHTDQTCSFESAKADCNGGANDDPVASFNYSPSTPAAGDNVSFDGTPSDDPDGSITSYDWDINGDGTIDATGNSTVYAYGSPGVYYATLTVTDDTGAVDRRTKRISVSDSSGDIPPVPEFSFRPPDPEPEESIALSAASSFDMNDDIVSYDWDFDADGTTDATGSAVNTSYASAGTHDITLTVTDSAGYTRSITKSVTVAFEGNSGSAYSIGAATSPVGISVEELNAAYVSDVSTQDWELGKTSAVRRFRFTVEDTALGTSVDSSSLTAQPILRNNAFHVLLTDNNGDEWRTYIYATASDEIAVATQQNDGSITVKYHEDIDEATIDLTSGTVNGADEDIAFANGLSQPYTIEYRNGDVARGTYMLVVPDDTFGSQTLRDGNFNSAPNTQSPYTSAGIYSARFRLTFNSPTVTYETTTLVAPNEPEDDS